MARTGRGRSSGPFFVSGAREVQMTKRVENVAEEKQQEMLPSYPLMKSIVAYGEEVRSIVMRKPNGADLLAIGNPVIFSPHIDPPRIEHDLPRVLQMIARLSQPSIPSTSLAALDPQDILGLAWHISPFFTPAR